MTIQELKQQIESGSVTDDLIIFKDTESGFISSQYVNAISKIRGVPIEFMNSPEDMATDLSNIFIDASTENKPRLGVVKSEVYVWGVNNVTPLKGLILIVSKFADKSTEKALEPYIVNVPKIEPWMIRDYVHSTVTGVDAKTLDYILNICGTNYLRLQQELDKILLFEEMERKYFVPALLQDGALDDLSTYNIFNFTNAITARNIDSIRSIYSELNRVDVNEFGLLTILLKNFRNMIMVQTSSNPTPENTGLDSKTLYAIKKLPRAYTPEQLVKIYTLLLDIDRQIKTGELPVEVVIDYMIVKILSM